MMAVSSSRAMRTGAESKRMLGVLVLLAQPPGAEADLQPTLGEHVERGELLGQHRRFAGSPAPARSG